MPLCRDPGDPVREFREANFYAQAQYLRAIRPELEVHFISNISKYDQYINIYPGMNKNVQQNKVFGMKFSIVEMVPTSDDIIFKLCPTSQLPYNAKFKK